MFSHNFEKNLRTKAQRLYLAQLLKNEAPREGITNRNPYTFHKTAIAAFVAGACWVKEQVEHHAHDMQNVAEVGKDYAAKLYMKRLRSQHYSIACQTAFMIGVGYSVELVSSSSEEPLA